MHQCLAGSFCGNMPARLLVAEFFCLARIASTSRFCFKSSM
jgi:hypothetical protein